MTTTTKGAAVMKAMLVGLMVAMGLSVGCAHGTETVVTTNGGRDVRGSVRVGEAARVIVVGPAQLVHATGEKPVRWFVAARVSGGDGDCANPAPGQPLAESTGAHLTVAGGHVLCAAVAKGATDVMWHEMVEPADGVWALR
jgi:hypothetical protein